MAGCFVKVYAALAALLVGSLVSLVGGGPELAVMAAGIILAINYWNEEVSRKAV